MKCTRCGREFEVEDKAIQINEGYIGIKESLDKKQFTADFELHMLCEKCWKNLAIMLL